MALQISKSPAISRALIWLLWLGFAFTFIVISVVNTPLINPAASAGIISFEFARTPERAFEILSSWTPELQSLASFNLGFDYLFMVSYALALSIACFWTGRILLGAGWSIGYSRAVLAAAVWCAVIFDSIENLGLVLVLLKRAGSPWPEIASIAAVIKFSLLSLAIVYIITGIIVFLRAKLISSSRLRLILARSIKIRKCNFLRISSYRKYHEKMNPK